MPQTRSSICIHFIHKKQCEQQPCFSEVHVHDCFHLPIVSAVAWLVSSALLFNDSAVSRASSLAASLVSLPDSFSPFAPCLVASAV